MKRSLEALFDRFRPQFEEGGRYEWAWPLFEGAETFLLTPGSRTRRGAHVRDPMDMKRLMFFVIYALVPCILFAFWNTGRIAYLYEGVAQPGFLESVVRGAVAMLPIIVVSYAAGGAAELLFCIVRKHEVNEGFLVTAMLFPLTLPPTIPLWQVAAGIVFGVIVGKEVFGGVGMNILNPALTARAFCFFTYPAQISGAKVWDLAGKDWFGQPEAVVDGYTGATPLLVLANAMPGTDPVVALQDQGWSLFDLFIGTIPGSVGETSVVACALGALFLVITGIGSWRTMVACVVGLLGMGGLLNLLAAPDSVAMMHLPAYYHLALGGFAFGAVFMATDPVTSAATPRGQWLYGIAIGALCVLVRVHNPAYPEGMMLAILFMNVFAPLIDYVVVRRTTRSRAARMAAAAS